MELAAGKELFQIVNQKIKYEVKERHRFTPWQVHCIMRDLLSAVSVMHYSSVIHRDLKLENIRFSQKNNYDTIKIYDFGSACIHNPGSDTKHYDMAGSPQYAAPEMLSGQGYNEKADIWSCGVIFYFLLTNSFPFDAKTPIELIHKI